MNQTTIDLPEQVLIMIVSRGDVRPATAEADASSLCADVLHRIGSVSRLWRCLAKGVLMGGELAWLRVPLFPQVSHPAPGRVDPVEPGHVRARFGPGAWPLRGCIGHFFGPCFEEESAAQGPGLLTVPIFAFPRKTRGSDGPAFRNSGD